MLKGKEKGKKNVGKEEQRKGKKEKKWWNGKKRNIAGREGKEIQEDML